MNLVGVAISKHSLEKFQALHKGPAPKRWDKAVISAAATARRVKLLRSTRAVRNFFKHGAGADYYVNDSGMWFVLSTDRPRVVLTVYRADNLRRGIDWDYDGKSDGR